MVAIMLEDVKLVAAPIYVDFFTFYKLNEEIKQCTDLHCDAEGVLVSLVKAVGRLFTSEGIDLARLPCMILFVDGIWDGQLRDLEVKASYTHEYLVALPQRIRGLCIPPIDNNIVPITTRVHAYKIVKLSNGFTIAYFYKERNM